MSTHYEVLGVPFNAAPELIRTAYKKAEAEAKAKGDKGSLALIRTAWLVLGDASHRAEYDKMVRSLLETPALLKPMNPLFAWAVIALPIAAIAFGLTLAIGSLR